MYIYTHELHPKTHSRQIPIQDLLSFSSSPFLSCLLQFLKHDSSQPPNSLWYPGKKLEGFRATQLSARALEIARSREELLGLLHELPESEHELSFSDLVDKSATGNNDSELCTESDKKQGVKLRKKMRRNSSNGFGGSTKGVLLNVYMPSSLTRSLTTSRASRETGTMSPNLADDCAKRDKEPILVGCLSGLWEKKREKTKKHVVERKRRGS